MDWRERDGVKWLEAALPGATAAFSTRIGGVSEGDFATLNLGLLTDDEPEAVGANRHRLAAALDRDPEGVLFGHQVHEVAIQRRDVAPAPNPFTALTPLRDKADAQVTTSPALTPLVQVADCLPIALAGDRGVAMLHCGWRPLAGGLIKRGVEEVDARAAAIGPGIGQCCYEVGAEVLERFAELDGVADGRMLDLAAVARQLLARAGVETVEASDLCTSCTPELFFSHRRDAGRTGRQAGLVWVDPGAAHA
jgi:purine-nucleoside/S-methyl-5'-thioadenosine phosphorylase / adenosine deaminase